MTNIESFALTIKHLEVEDEFILLPQPSVEIMLKYIEKVEPLNKYLVMVRNTPYILIKGVHGCLIIHDDLHETYTYYAASLWYNDEFCELLYYATVDGLCVTRLIFLADNSVSNRLSVPALLQQCKEYTDQCYTSMNAIRQFG